MAGREFGGKARSDGDDVILLFGKHRGRSLRELARREPSYLRWMLTQDFSGDLRERVQEALGQAQSTGDVLQQLSPDDWRYQVIMSTPLLQRWVEVVGALPSEETLRRAAGKSMPSLEQNGTEGRRE